MGLGQKATSASGTSMATRTVRQSLRFSMCFKTFSGGSQQGQSGSSHRNQGQQSQEDVRKCLKAGQRYGEVELPRCSSPMSPHSSNRYHTLNAEGGWFSGLRENHPPSLVYVGVAVTLLPRSWHGGVQQLQRLRRRQVHQLQPRSRGSGPSRHQCWPSQLPCWRAERRRRWTAVHRC